MGDPRPVDDTEGQEAQASHLTDTGNGPTENDEAELLAEKYGEPTDGVYGAPAQDAEATA